MKTGCDLWCGPAKVLESKNSESLRITNKQIYRQRLAQYQPFAGTPHIFPFHSFFLLSFSLFLLSRIHHHSHQPWLPFSADLKKSRNTHEQYKVRRLLPLSLSFFPFSVLLLECPNLGG